MIDKSTAEQLAVQNGMVRRGRPVDIQIWSATNDDLLNFANACYAAGQADEREACALSCDPLRHANESDGHIAQLCQDDIRARTTVQT